MHTTTPETRLNRGTNGIKSQDGGAEMGACINISGSYKIRQSNGAHVNVTWQQNGHHLDGYASIVESNTLSKSLEGTVEGEHVDFNIEWSDGIIGHYWADLFEPFSHVAWQGVLMGDCKVEATGGWAHWEVEDVTFTGLQPQHPVNTSGNW
ncbi:hypothetical protein [Streptomyces sp. NPDC003863]